MIEGGCNCKGVRYKLDVEKAFVAQCHCKNCQRQSGSAFSVNLLAPADKVSVTGEIKTYRDTDTLSGNAVLREFCPNCGSPIFSKQEGSDQVIVKAGTLDDPTPFAPKAAVWTSTAWPWVEPAGKMQFPQNAPG